MQKWTHVLTRISQVMIFQRQGWHWSYCWIQLIRNRLSIYHPISFKKRTKKNFSKAITARTGELWHLIGELLFASCQSKQSVIIYLFLFHLPRWDGVTHLCALCLSGGCHKVFLHFFFATWDLLKLSMDGTTKWTYACCQQPHHLSVTRVSALDFIKNVEVTSRHLFSFLK